MHNTLDDGNDGMNATIPPENSWAFSAVLQFITAWVCSFVGIGDERRTQQERETSWALREQVYTFSQCLAAENGLRTEDPGGPTPGYVFCWIVDNAVYHPRKGDSPYNGKSSAMHHWNTFVHFDDNLKVCRDCEESGILCYHIRVKGGTYRPHFLNEDGGRHWSFVSFPLAIRQYIKDIKSGDIMRKINLVLANAKFLSEDYVRRYNAAARACELMRDPTGRYGDQLFWPEGLNPYGQVIY